MLAGSVVRIEGRDDEIFTEPGILAPFETSCQNWDWKMLCQIVDKLAPPEGTVLFEDPGRKVFEKNGRIITYIGAVEKSIDGAYIRVERQNKESCAQVKRSALRGPIPAKTVLTALEAEHIVVANGGFLLHASCVCHEGKAILFTAPSGTGKSTQAALWEKYRGAEIINGDRIMVKSAQEGCEAVGIPFFGSSGICKNRTMPIQAIVYLEQGKQTKIKRLTGVRAFRSIWEGCSLHSWNRKDVELCMKNVGMAIEKVPVYHLSCTPDVTAIEAVESVLKESEG